MKKARSDRGNRYVTLSQFKKLFGRFDAIEAAIIELNVGLNAKITASMRMNKINIDSAIEAFEKRTNEKFQILSQNGRLREASFVISKRIH